VLHAISQTQCGDIAPTSKAPSADLIYPPGSRRFSYRHMVQGSGDQPAGRWPQERTAALCDHLPKLLRRSGPQKAVALRPYQAAKPITRPAVRLITAFGRQAQGELAAYPIPRGSRFDTGALLRACATVCNARAHPSPVYQYRAA